MKQYWTENSTYCSKEFKDEGIVLLLKGIGGLLVISASGILGILHSNKLSLRYKELVNLRRVMQMLETEVTYGATPLPVALYSVSKKTEGPVSRFLANVSEHLSKRSFYTLKEAWNDSAERLLMESSLIKADIEFIKSFGNILGCSDREDQKKHFQLFYIQLRHQEDSAMEEVKRSAEMYRSLGFLLGMAVFVVLA